MNFSACCAAAAREADQLGINKGDTMSLTLRLTGTGGAQLVPVFGCDCAACRRARREESHRRRL